MPGIMHHVIAYDPEIEKNVRNTDIYTDIFLYNVTVWLVTMVTHSLTTYFNK